MAFTLHQLNRHQWVKGSPLYLFTFLSFILFSFLCLSCDKTDTRFRIDGKFKNMNQAELFLINLQEGTKDTLHVTDGRFSYETNLSDTTTMIIVFPNFSELPIIAEPGKDIDIEGDASHLKATTVEGSANNELMTAFRMKTNDMMPPDIVKEAEKYIKQHAGTPVAAYLLRRYFIIAAEGDYEKTVELATIIRDAQPTRVSIVQMYNQVEALRNIKTTGKIPDFKAIDTKGHEVTNDTLNTDINVICLWTSWNYNSQSMLRQLGRLQKDNPEKISVVFITIDATPEEGKLYLERDSLKFPHICDSLQWESPLIRTLGFAYVPDNIITDRQGNIVARSLGNDKLKEKIEELLGNTASN